MVCDDGWDAPKSGAGVDLAEGYGVEEKSGGWEVVDGEEGGGVVVCNGVSCCCWLI